MADFCGFPAEPVTYAKDFWAHPLFFWGSPPLWVADPLGRTRDFQAPLSSRARPTIPATRSAGVVAARPGSAGVDVPRH